MLLEVGKVLVKPIKRLNSSESPSRGCLEILQRLSKVSIKTVKVLLEVRRVLLEVLGLF